MTVRSSYTRSEPTARNLSLFRLLAEHGPDKEAYHRRQPPEPHAKEQPFRRRQRFHRSGDGRRPGSRPSLRADNAVHTQALLSLELASHVGRGGSVLVVGNDVPS